MAQGPTATMIPFIVILILSYAQAQIDCPQDCVCHQEFLSNLEAWKWVEKDVNVQKDDPLHEDFNPYTEHNEVYDNPAVVKRRQTEQILNTVTCMLRTNSSTKLANSLGQLKSFVQILSLIQAPGSGIINLEASHLENLVSLIGLEVQGYSDPSGHQATSLNLEADALSNLKNLAYLSVNNVHLNQSPVQESEDEMKFNFTYNREFVDNEQVIVIKAKNNTEETIVPYSVYKNEPKTQQPSKNVKRQVKVAFTKLPTLQHLRITSCNLQDISWDMFYKLDSLQFLLLENNELLFLPDFVFYATTNLTSLSLSNNRILNLQTVGLAGLLSLQKLDVSHNNITYLSELSLPPFPFLEVADFTENPIETIFPNTFEIMNSTKTLFLGSKNTPLEFSANSFYGLVALIRLDVVNAHIQFLERGILKGMPKLKSMTMTGVIPRVMYDAFSEVPKLEKLILKQCSIQKISMDAFFGLTSLIELDLSHNQLSFLPPGLFEQQVSLREIFLQYNKLTTLPPSIFSKLPSKIIRLEGNPWYCSCDMKYWEDRQINQVKRYHVPPPTFNNSFCDPNYYKQSLCFESYEPKWEPRYVYEKRVSPICSAPQTFRNRNVFEVLRNGLHLCANSLQQNISILLTSSNPTETLEIMGTVKVPSSKEIEKQLLFPPKIRKPNKVKTPTLTTVAIQRTTASQDQDLSTRILSTSPTFTEHDDSIFTTMDDKIDSSHSSPFEFPINPTLDYTSTSALLPTTTTTRMKSKSRERLGGGGKRRGKGRGRQQQPQPTMETIQATQAEEIEDDNRINIIWSPPSETVPKAETELIKISEGATNETETRRGNSLRTNSFNFPMFSQKAMDYIRESKKLRIEQMKQKRQG